MNIKLFPQLLSQHVYWLLNKQAILEHVQREEDILRVRMVLPAESHYHARPTFDQVKRLVEEIEMVTMYSARSLYVTLCSGSIPSEVDAIIRKHAQGWAPVEASERGSA